MTVNKSSHQQGAKLRFQAPERRRNLSEQMRLCGQALHLAVIWPRGANTRNEAGSWDTDSKKSEHELKFRNLPVCLPEALITIAWAGIGNECVNAMYHVISEGGVLCKGQSRSCWWKNDLLNVYYRRMNFFFFFFLRYLSLILKIYLSCGFLICQCKEK